MEYFQKIRSVRGFFTALASTLESLRMLFSGRSLLRFVILPFFLNIVLLIALFTAALLCIYPFAAGLLPSGDIWYFVLLRFVVKPFIVLTLAAMVLLLYSITGALLAIPFADALVRSLTESAGKRIGGNAVRSAVYGISTIVIFLSADILVSLFNIIPFFGSLLYLVLTAFLLCFFLGSQVYDVVAGGSYHSFSSRLNDYWKMKWCMCGLGLSFLVLAAVPLLGFLSPVICSASAARIYCQLPDPE